MNTALCTQITKSETLNSTWSYNSTKSVSNINNSKVSLYAYIHISLRWGNIQSWHSRTTLDLTEFKAEFNIAIPRTYSGTLQRETIRNTVPHQVWVHNPCVKLLSPWYVLMLHCKILLGLWQIRNFFLIFWDVFNLGRKVKYI